MPSEWPLVAHNGPSTHIILLCPFGREGDALIILLGGGTKTRQQKDIKTAHDLWQEYRRRKRRET